MALQMLPKQAGGKEYKLGINHAGVEWYKKKHMWVMLEKQPHLLNDV